MEKKIETKTDKKPSVDSGPDNLDNIQAVQVKKHLTCQHCGYPVQPNGACQICRNCGNSTGVCDEN